MNTSLNGFHPRRSLAVWIFIAFFLCLQPGYPTFASTATGLGQPGVGGVLATQRFVVPQDATTANSAQTLLDEAGQYKAGPMPIQVGQWRQELHQFIHESSLPQPGSPLAFRAATLHISIGEYTLGHDEQPEQAMWHFRQAMKLSKPSDPTYGLAKYDIAIALYNIGAYAQSEKTFHELLFSKRARGYDFRACALWYRRAAASYGYHCEHADAGIPEMPQLDPLCGAAAFATCLRALSLPYDKAAVSKACHVTGFGTSSTGIVDAASQYGLIARQLASNDEGLVALPKPLIAFVEHDHFVAVLKASSNGVTYTCSECGPWPGGEVHVTWPQWDMLSTGYYIAITKPNSSWDKVLAAALSPSSDRSTASAGVKVASAGSLTSLGLGRIAPMLQSLSQLRLNVVLYQKGNGANGGIQCGSHPNSLHCPPNVHAPRAAGGNCGGAGPLGGDPVNLATGEEELHALPDLTVYNPTGPFVSWERLYNSMRPCGGVNFLYEDDDFGQGWSQAYNMTVLDQTATRKTICSPVTAGEVYWSGHDAPANGATWDVTLNGSVIASSSNTNGWIFDSTYGTDIAPPSSATISTAYEVRWYNGSADQSAFFDVVAGPSIPQGYLIDLIVTGSDAPANGQAWDIVYNGNVIATSSQPAGWNVIQQSIPGLQVTAPPGAAIGSGYEARSVIGDRSATFSICAPDYGAAAGTKYVYEADGSRLQFNAPSVPTASNPAVECTASTSGTPMLLEWDYSAGDQTGYYTVTLPDRTKWITTGSANVQLYGDLGGINYFDIYHQLAQIVDRNGNAIDFNYGPPAPSTPAGGQPVGSSGGSGFPLLASITQNSTGSTLLTINRTNDGTGHVASVTDAYGRSVYYQSTTFSTTDGMGDAENMPFVSQVSQIVPTGTLSPPMKYSYTYENVSAFGDGNLPFLYQISVPSPTGSGTSTASFSYDGSGAVTKIVDSDGNSRTFTPLNTSPSDDFTSNRTQVTISDPHNNTVYSYTVSFDNNLSEMSCTDGTNQVYTFGALYQDPNDPYEPSAYYPNGNSVSEVPVTKSWSVMFLGADQHENGVIWDVLNPSGTVIATSSSPNGWSVPSENATVINLTAPSTAPLESGYEVRAQYYDVYDTLHYISGYFTLIPASAMYKQGIACVWDQFGNLHKTTDPNGTVTNYTWGYPSSTLPTVVNSQLKSNAFPMGELLSVQEGTKSPTSYTYYEPSGLLNTVTTPLPGTVGSSQTASTSFTYDSLGNVLTVSTPAANNTPGATITTTYDYTSDPTYTYTQNDAIGQPITVTDNLGNITHYRYNSRGLLITKIDALGNETDYGAYAGDQNGGYDIADDPLQVTYPATGQSGSSRGYTLNSYQYPGGPLASTTTYDESGNQVAEVSNSYDPEGLTLTVTGSKPPVACTYDADYRVTGVTDGDGHTTTYTYNTAGYLYQIAYPDAAGTTPGSYDTVTYTSYDRSGNPLVRLDGNGVETDYTYNNQDDLLTDIHYPGGQLADTTFSYDGYGRRTALVDATGSQTYTYDDLNDLLTDTTSFAGGPSGAEIAYGYYPNSSRESMSTPAGGFGYGYDGDGRLTNLTNPSSEASSWTYLNNDWLKTQTLGNGVLTTYTYNALGEVTDLLNQTSGASTLSDFGSMVYNGAGDRDTVTANMPGYPAYDGTTTFTYDVIAGVGTRHQLSQELSGRNGGYTNTFVYDGGGYGASYGVGNPTTFQGSTNSFNSDNQNSAYTYNGNGDPSTYAGVSASYDPENRLTAFGSLLTAGYNGDGMRAVKADSTGTTYYLFDGAAPVCELNSSGAVTATNTFGPNGLLSRSTGASSIFYTFDQQGNVAQRLDTSENILTSDLYDAFGAHSSSGNPTDPFGFEGKFGYYTDRATGLILCTHRYYDPAQGRFVNRDPIRYAGGANLYGYVANAAGNAVDESGEGPGTTAILLGMTMISGFNNIGKYVAQNWINAFQGTQARVEAPLGNSSGPQMSDGSPAEESPMQELTDQIDEANGGGLKPGDMPDENLPGIAQPGSAEETLNAAGVGETEAVPIVEAATTTGADGIGGTAAGVGTAGAGGCLAEFGIGAAAVWAIGDSINEIRNYTPGHPAGIFTDAGDWWADQFGLGPNYGDVCPQ